MAPLRIGVLGAAQLPWSDTDTAEERPAPGSPISRREGMLSWTFGGERRTGTAPKSGDSRSPDLARSRATALILTRWCHAQDHSSAHAHDGPFGKRGRAAAGWAHPSRDVDRHRVPAGDRRPRPDHRRARRRVAGLYTVVAPVLPSTALAPASILILAWFAALAWKYPAQLDCVSPPSGQGVAS
jgi:hypothetical protein